MTKLTKPEEERSKMLMNSKKPSSKIKELIAMAKTIENNLHGITSYWTTNALSNAETEGFNNIESKNRIILLEKRIKR